MTDGMCRKVVVGELLAWATSVLCEHGVPDPRWDAELLLGSVIGKPALMLPLLAADEVPLASVEQYRGLIGRRATREPLQYILGRQEFMGLTFAVDKRVLVPRPETEHLIEAITSRLDALIRDRAARGLFAALQVVDIGTGSGAIAVALAARVANLRIFATDISADALDVAADNAARQGVTDRIVFVQGNLFTPLPADLHGRVALVASNPPYIASGELPRLQAEVQREPRPALDGGSDGLDFYRRLVAEAPRWLCAGGLLALEIGDRQGEAVAAMITGAGAYCSHSIEKDYAGHDRVVLAKIRGDRECSSR